MTTVLKIWYECNLEAHNFIKEEYWNKNIAYVKKTIPKSEVYLYEVSGEVVGFIALEASTVSGIFVKKEFQNDGIGTKLIQFAKEERDNLYLYVFENNQNAVKFYESRGFQKIKTEVHEDLGEVEYVMHFTKKKLEEV